MNMNKIILSLIFILPSLLILAQDKCVVIAKANNNQSIRSKFYIGTSTLYGCHTFSELLFINPTHPFHTYSGIKVGKSLTESFRESFVIQTGILFFGLGDNLIPMISGQYYADEPSMSYKNFEIPFEVKFIMADKKDKVSAHIIGGIYNSIVIKRLQLYVDQSEPVKTKTRFIYNTIYLSIGFGVNCVIAKNTSVYLEPIWKYSLPAILGRNEYLTYKDQFGIGAGVNYYFTLNNH